MQRNQKSNSQLRSTPLSNSLETRGIPRPPKTRWRAKNAPDGGPEMTIYRYRRPELEFRDFGEVEVTDLHGGHDHVERFFSSRSHCRAHLPHIR